MAAIIIAIIPVVMLLLALSQVPGAVIMMRLWTLPLVSSAYRSTEPERGLAKRDVSYQVLVLIREVDR